MAPFSYRESFITTQDGLRIFARDYGERTSTRTPVVCLPGLTRNSKDFETLAEHLAPTRRVLCPDLRGRGRSQYCDNWTDYTPATELIDVLDVMAASGIAHAVFVGTSRGGLITMLLGAFRPATIKAAVLNDVGPEIDMTGLKRIAGYAGVMNAPTTWDEAAVQLRMMNEREFPTVTGNEWRAFSARTFAEEHGAPKLDYDPRIGLGLRKGLEALGSAPMPDMWPQFKALSNVPVMGVRGENSDLLSSETFERMAREHPNFTSLTLKDRGHAPFLDEPEFLAAMDQFLARENL